MSAANYATRNPALIVIAAALLALLLLAQTAEAQFVSPQGPSGGTSPQEIAENAQSSLLGIAAAVAVIVAAALGIARFGGQDMKGLFLVVVGFVVLAMMIFKPEKVASTGLKLVDSII